MKTFRIPLLVATLAGIATPAWSLDLLDAYRAAEEQDPSVQAARAAADAGRERLPQARAQLLPALSASATRNKLNRTTTGPNFLGRETTTYNRFYSGNETLSLRQPLYRKPLFAAYEQAGYVVEDANASLEVELQDLGVRVSGAYMEALLAQDQVALVEAQKETTTAQLDWARKALTAGSGTRTDIDEAQARLDLAVAQELAARQNLDYTRRQLEQIINQPAQVLSPLDVEKMPLATSGSLLVDDWIQRAEQNNPQIQALTARREAARLEVEKASGDHYPTVDLVAQWSNSDSEDVSAPKYSYRDKMIGVQFNMPLFTGGYVSSTVRQARAEQRRAEDQLEAARRDLGTRVHKEFRGITEGILRVRALEQAVRSAEQMVLSSRKSLQAGARTQIDVLNAQQQRMSALRDLAEARYTYLMARIRLQALVGGDRLAAITEVNGWLQH